MRTGCSRALDRLISSSIDCDSETLGRANCITAITVDQSESNSSDEPESRATKHHAQCGFRCICPRPISARRGQIGNGRMVTAGLESHVSPCQSKSM
jgi:hypothetical protein